MRLRTHLHARKGERGIILLWSIFVAFVVMASTLVVTTLASSSKQLSAANVDGVRAEYLAQASIEHAKQVLFGALLANTAPPAQGTVTIDGFDVTYTIEEQLAPTMAENRSGLNVIRSIYHLEGRARVGNSLKRARRVVRGDVVPLFQFALFYEEEMHFLYPAPMHVAGPVHCNSDVYFYAHRGLTFDTNHLRVAGSVFGRKKHARWDTDYPWGPAYEVSVRRWVADPFAHASLSEFADLQSKHQLDAMDIPSYSGFDSSFAGWDEDGDGHFAGADDWKPFAAEALERWSPPDMYAGDGAGSTLKTGEHGVKRVEIPKVEDFSMYLPAEQGAATLVWSDHEEGFVEAEDPAQATHRKGSYFADADLSVISYPNGTWKAFVGDIEVTSEIASAVSLSQMYDARQAEGSSDRIQMTVIDLGELADTDYFPHDGTLYVAGEGAGQGTDVKGFQLTNGARLAGDLTVVSPDSVYLHGDYNTESIKSAAVLADALNLLSKSWDNGKEQGHLPSASSTTYNVSFVAGDTEATPGNFNGGPHNLPRFHENWTGRTCTINGSMVCLGHSTKATGTFAVSGDYYRAPNRNWSYDPRLNELGNLPPSTPVYVDLIDVVTW